MTNNSIKNKKFKTRISLTLLLVIFFFVFVLPLAQPTPVKAQFSDPIAFAQRLGKNIWDFMKESWRTIKRTSAAVFYKNVIKQVVGQLAEETAVWLATGGKDKGPLFHWDKAYWEKMEDDILGEFIDRTAGDFLGQSLCDPIDPTLKFNLLVSLDPKYREHQWKEEVECSLSQIKKRVKEASKKKLFDISADLEIGTAKRYETDLENLICDDKYLTVVQKKALNGWYRAGEDEYCRSFGIPGVEVIEKGIIYELKKIQSNFEMGINAIKKAEDEKNDAERQKIIKGYNKEGHLKALENVGIKIKEWRDKIKPCISLDQTNFCNKCFNFCQEPFTGKCNEKYADCKKAFDHIDLYTKQLIEWKNVLKKLVGQVDTGALLAPTELSSLEDVSKSFSPEASDIGVSIKLENKIYTRMAKKVGIDKFFTSLGGLTKSKVSKISGNVETPASKVAAMEKQMIEKGGVGLFEYTGEVLADAVGIFTNTLVSKLLTNAMKGEFPWTPKDDKTRDYSGLLDSGYNTRTRKAPPGGETETPWMPSEEETRARFSSFAQVNLIEAGVYDLINNFSTCPEERKYSQVNNCVIDAPLSQAIEQKMTIEEAIAKNFLHGSWSVGGMTTDSTEDYISRYSLTNIKKLRRARILPLGLEIAATMIKEDPSLAGSTKTLKQIIDDFGREGPTPGCQGTPAEINNGEGLFCHLVDPKWVLKAPTYYCKAMAYGAVPIAESGERSEVCIDVQDAIAENDKGESLSYGYCAREKNIWRFNADECPFQYVSCENFKKATDKKQYSYLKDTLDFKGCDQTNVGCRWYCQDYQKGGWNCKSPGVDSARGSNPENAIFFNRSVKKCELENEGCSLFQTETGEDLYLKKPPSYLGCNAGLVKNDPNYNSECGRFAQPCYDREVGCNLYAPLAGGPNLTAVSHEENNCPALCLGYETFLESGTRSSDSRSVNLIPSTAKACRAQEVNCEEYTNLDEIARGGEGKEYYTYLRQCAKLPEAESACKYYYTWLGSETAGYQLKRYQLKKADDGSPLKTPIPQTELEKFGPCKTADDALTNSHCKEFYDDSGATYYVIYENTITCSENCHPLRKTDLVKREYCSDPSINYQDKTGTLGICTYYAIPEEGIACSAASVGCREYKGNAANNLREVLFSDFEKGSTEGWTGGEVVSEATKMGEHSIKATSGQFSISSQGIIFPGNSYLLSFWVKGPGSYQPKITLEAGAIDFGSKTVMISEWQEISFGPVYVERTESPKNLVITLPAGSYLDKISLKEVQENLYLIKDSWQTPEICDTPYPGAELGCKEYQDKDRQTHYLKSFASLCRSEAVGCQKLTDTFNSSATSTLEYTFEVGDNLKVVVPADQTIYLVNNKDKQCKPEKKGCQKFGLPKIATNNLLLGFDNVWLINDPDLYKPTGAVPTILCLSNGLNCEEYSQGASTLYFKDPGEKICEYKEKIYYNGQDTSGWFKKGGNEPCSPDYKMSGILGVRKANDPLYEGWVGVCPTQQAGCIEFKDPLGEVVWHEGFNTDTEAPSGLADKWSIYCGGGHGSGCSDNANSATTKTLDSTDKKEGDYSQKISFNASCQGEVGGSCGSTDLGFSRTYSPTEIKELKPGKDYTLSIFGKVSDTINGWYLMMREYYDLKNSAGKLLAVDLDTQKECEDRNNDRKYQGYWVWTGTSCYHDLVAQKIQDALWHKISLHLYLDPKDWEGLSRYEIILGGPKTGIIYYDNLVLQEYTPYYYLNNNKLDRSSCAGQVGLRDGCVLFYDPSNSNLTYNSAETYSQSSYKSPPDSKVSTVSCSTGEASCDTNLILKVRRDRTCGEWLTCVSSKSIWDKTAGKYQEVCEAIGRCNLLVGKGSSSVCGSYVYEATPQPLSEPVYKGRDVSWVGQDYSGMSIYNMYPVERLKSLQSTVDKDGNGPLDYYLAYNATTGVDGSTTTPIITIEQTCQSFPEKDSPFTQGAKDSYQLENVCQNDANAQTGASVSGVTGAKKQCQCFYKKIKNAEGQILYYNFDYTTSASSAIFAGQKNFCLESDETKPGDLNACLTWWPGAAAGNFDVSQQFETAGFKGVTDASSLSSKNYYCTAQKNYTWIVYGYAWKPQEWKNIHEWRVSYGGKCCGCDQGCPTNYYLSGFKEEWSPIENCAKWKSWTCYPDSGDGCYIKNTPTKTSYDQTACTQSRCYDGTTQITAFTNQTECEWSHCYSGTTYVSTLTDKVACENAGQCKDGATVVADSLCTTKTSNAVTTRCSKIFGFEETGGKTNKPWTDRLWSGSSSKPTSSAFSAFSSSSTFYNTTNKPYGAITYGPISSAISTRATEPWIGREVNLKNLFAQYGTAYAYDLQNNTGSYSPTLLSGDFAGPPPGLGTAAKAPQIASVKRKEGEGFEMGTQKMTIGGAESGDIKAFGIYMANLKFYAWADKNQMPIREVVIDWGDEKVSGQGAPMMVKNHVDECINRFGRFSWAGRKPEACEDTIKVPGDAYFLYNHVYSCSVKSSYYNKTSGTCSFIPKVYVKDNWGWCLGGGYVGDGSCYYIGSTSFVPFAGHIILEPTTE